MENPYLIELTLLNLVEGQLHNLPVQEQKIVSYLTSKMEPQDQDSTIYEFYIEEFCRACEIDYSNHKHLNVIIKTLADKSFEFPIEDYETWVRWITYSSILACGKIQLKPEELIKPYLLKLKNLDLLMPIQY